MSAKFGTEQGGRRIRLGKRVTGAAAAFTALAALTGSHVTGLGLVPVAAADPAALDNATAASVVAASSTLPDPGPTATRLPNTPDPAAPGGGPVDGGGTIPLPQPPGTLPGEASAAPFRTGPALPETVFAAYRKAESALALRSPGCHLPWQLLAAIGEVESGQADRGRVDTAGTTYRAILGPVLDGKGFAAIADTDGGRFDGDRVWDRAVGPMQFIPSTWAYWGVDANGDGQADPNNIFDAAEGAGRYLCAGGRNLSDPAQLDRAVLGYNNSGEYLRTVRNWMAHFGSGTPTTTPDRPAAPGAAAAPTTAQPTTAQPTAPTTQAPATPEQVTASPSAAQPSPSAQPSTTPSATPSAGPSTSPSAGPSTSPTATATAAPSTTPTTAPSPTGSPSPSAQPTGTPSATPSTTPTGTPTACASPTATATGTATATPSGSPSGTPTNTASGTPSATPSGTPSATPTGPGCVPAAPGATASAAPSAVPSGSAAASPSATSSPSPSAAAAR
ncbi:lytic transglycosylase domain-containing protein [Kitasatospora sp. NPDC058170]|uniref:lytic transglycosylase domain-containing protein n=1 Tax=Kitasatospora sp. NPDC058170 TaxID=3346364 RepID=UPI0036D9DFA9